MLNISGRVVVQNGDNIGIGGFIISGNGSKKIGVRGLGPSIQSGGKALKGRMDDPFLELRSSDGHLVQANDNWRDTQEQEVNDSGLAPSDTRESVIIATLAGGEYTASLTGTFRNTGIGLIEIYDLEDRKSVV